MNELGISLLDPDDNVTEEEIEDHGKATRDSILSGFAIYGTTRLFRGLLQMARWPGKAPGRSARGPHAGEPKLIPPPVSGPIAGAPALVDTNLMINALERGNAAALATIRASNPSITVRVYREFVLAANTHAQRMQRMAFLEAEGITILPKSEAALLRSTPEFKTVYQAVVKAGHSVTDAEMAAFARASGREVLTAEKRLTNLMNLSLHQHSVRIYRGDR
jgi:predicted nucleic acid-binding protein